MKREMKVGLFFIIGMLILGILTFYSGSLSDWFQKKYTLYANFEKVDGLVENDPVTLAGVEIGEVKKMRIRGAQVEVALLINRDAIIRKDSTARIETESLLGGKYIGMTIGSPDAPILKDGDTVQTRQAADMTAILQNVADLAEDIRLAVNNFNKNQEKLASQIDDILGENRENIRETFASLNRIVTDNEEGIGETIENLRAAGPHLKEAMERVNEIARKMESGEGTLGKLVQDDSLYNDMRDLSAKLGEASDTVVRVLGDNEADMREAVASLREATPKMQATMERIDKISEKIEKGEGSLGKLIQDDALYDEATRMFKESRHAAEDLREQVPIITFTSVLFGAFQ
ncbi:MAG: MCE family protein [Candidatus Abyssobacteria bacterium SURF_5]|uniref:MCE family protein n=1 Tax=Abyssobacteria bacterium (strain SURF_5) TaxID=2093360 RepID=A0A3A4P1G9_ABYX5|nr:MAG: MCE family protein [Candidatus Abyssubacteria bacterium SURF_5]